MSDEESSMRGQGQGQGQDGDGVVRCREALERLSEFLDSELEDSEGDRIRSHLADCEPCLSEFDLEDHIKKLVRRSCTESAPAELHLRIRTGLMVLRGQLPD